MDDGVYEKIFIHAAAQISPTRAEAEEEKKFASKIAEKIIAQVGKGADIFWVGSAARDTGLRNDRDIDLFVSYPRELDEELIVKRTIDAVKRSVVGKWEMHYAQHPYLQAQIEGFKVEVIPCFKTAPHQDIKSAVDRSPLHMDYLQKRLNSHQKRDVRLLKKLLKVAGVYGAEVDVGGFSGIVCEYLILNYRSLLGLLVAASSWKPQVIVDIEAHRTGDDLTKEFSSPLILVDAIDKRRNAAASVSLSSFSKFIALAKSFLENPSKKFFENPKDEKLDKHSLQKKLSQRDTFLLGISFAKPRDVVSDILVPQLRKTMHSIKANCRMLGYPIIDCQEFVGENSCLLLFEFHSKHKHLMQKIIGPPAWQWTSVKKFVAAHKDDAIRGPYIEEDRIVVETICSNSDVSAAITEMIGSKNSVSIGSRFEKELSKAKLLENQQLLDGRNNEFLQNYLTRKESFWK